MSDKEMKMVEGIRNGYTEKKRTKLNEMMELDRKAKMPAIVFAYVFGVIASLVLGVGMCLAMEVLVISHGMAIGVVVGVVGLFMAAINYFLYQGIRNRGKRKYGAQILALSREILGEEY
ncbi:MAG: dihydropteridine reductase [Clostridia bacterium]|nr:dihydropteridine reductase [Clostridia bacterium]